jgi:sulfur transfer complex TusBCD TusB component (DsrH family)
VRNLPPGLPAPLLSALCQDSRMDDPRFFAVNQDLIARGVVDLRLGTITIFQTEKVNFDK